MTRTVYRNPETGDTISASGVVHGARHGLDVEGTDEEGVIVISGERYDKVER